MKEEVKKWIKELKDNLEEHERYTEKLRIRTEDKIKVLDKLNEIDLLIAEECNIARSEGEKTSRLTSLFNKIHKLK